MRRLWRGATTAGARRRNQQRSAVRRAAAAADPSLLSRIECRVCSDSGGQDGSVGCDDGRRAGGRRDSGGAMQAIAVPQFRSAAVGVGGRWWWWPVHAGS